MEDFILIQDPSEVQGWMADSFKKVYTEKPALSGMALAVLSENYESSDPDKIAVVMMRTFIQDSDLAKKDQKYIVGIRFYSFGDIASIDVISLDKGFHKEIIYEHQKRFGWPSYKGEIGKPIDCFEESYRVPFLVVGGHLAINNDNEIKFSGSSGDYGSTIFFSDSNSIAAFVAESCGLNVSSEEGFQKKGSFFIQEILEFILKYKLKPDFYEKIVLESYERNKGKETFSGQHFGALMTMKIEDRVIKENGNVLYITADELTDGFARNCILYGMANRMKHPE